ncbi:MAG TPA: NUDIX domain-containing protein [Chloroflexota bacterium]|nr:NUDIX domain-containing protein [Chloroflexota bacterium]
MESRSRAPGAPPEPAPSEPALIVISGMQGAGKSTVADHLARRLPRAARLNSDAMQHLIVTGSVWPESREMSAEAARQLRLRLRHVCLLGRSFVEAGFTAVLDDIVIGLRLDHLLEELRGWRFIFVMLTPRLDVVRLREQGRGTRLYETWSWMDEEIRTNTRRLGLWLDTSHQSVDETVETILRRAWREGWVEAPAPSPPPAPAMYVNARAIIEREGELGTEVLVQVRDRPGAGGVLELPGGTLTEYEPILDGLAREVREETGLQVSEILDGTGRLVWRGVRPDGTPGADYECLRAAFVYQTLRGPIDSIGFFFRCRAEGQLVERGDLASGHRWIAVSELRRLLTTAPQTFHGLSQAALAFYTGLSDEG